MNGVGEGCDGGGNAVHSKDVVMYAYDDIIQS